MEKIARRTFLQTKFSGIFMVKYGMMETASLNKPGLGAAE